MLAQAYRNSQIAPPPIFPYANQPYAPTEEELRRLSLLYQFDRGLNRSCGLSGLLLFLPF
jgi:hypothetical protein